MTSIAYPDPVDGWAAAEGTVEHVHAQATRYLTAQLDAATAADQRAITAASVFSAAAAALVALAVGRTVVASSIAIYLTAFSLVIAAALCAYAARPTKFDFPGNVPSSWWSAEHDSLKESLGSELMAMQEMIDCNAEVIERNAESTKLGLIVALAAPFVGIVSWFFASLL